MGEDYRMVNIMCRESNLYLILLEHIYLYVPVCLDALAEPFGWDRRKAARTWAGFLFGAGEYVEDLHGR